ncbi:MAG: hypothetical protein NC541_08745 [bacterium]|nr:hypothetical protein [bacterium]
MNKMYAKRNGKPVNNSESSAVRQARLLVERQNAAREKSEQILNQYRHGQQRGMRV